MKKEQKISAEEKPEGFNRRTFLKYTGMGAAYLGIASAGVTGISSCGVEKTKKGVKSSCRSKPAPVTQKEAEAIALEAYIYLYPLITMDITRKVCTNIPAGAKEGLGPMNMFHHFKSYPDANFREVVRPNFDTLYSIAWLDITKEPLILSVPDTNGRYYLMPMLDMWTDVFAVPGKRTTGTSAANYALLTEDWSGDIPDGIEVIYSHTPYLWIVGRTQTNGPKDYEAVHKVQEGYKITPLSDWGKTPRTIEFKQDPSVDMKTPPVDQVNNMPADKYFSYGAELMKLHKPHQTDYSQIERLRRIGITPGQSFDFGKTDPVAKAAMEKAVKDGVKYLQENSPRVAQIFNGWQMNRETMGVYGNNYLKRAIIAYVGLGANQPDDAIYPLNFTDSEGKKLFGENKYLLHFNKEELPPANAFWSVTMYDKDGFQSANPINRFAIGDRDELKYNPDGSLDIYIQHDSPGKDKESNWLPAPFGELGVTMRLYSPKMEVIDGRWNPPAIKKI